ncbi:MAG: hypothetical protein AAF531_13985 [Actinomycetota bacterium]
MDMGPLQTPSPDRRPGGKRRLAFAAVVMLAAASILAPGHGPAHAQGGGSVVVTFDDYPANISGSPAASPITTEYRGEGLTFPFGATALVFDDSSFPPRPDLPRSGDTVISTCYSQEFCSSRIIMEFDPPLADLSAHAGYYGSLSQRADLLLEGFNEDGKVVATDTVTIPAADQATPATNPLSITSETGEIVAAQIRWVDESRFLSLLIVDDVTLAPFVAAPELTTEPSPIELTVEEDRVTVDIEVTNTGNVTLVELLPTLDNLDDLTDKTDLRLALNHDAGCFLAMSPGQPCPVVITATPAAGNTIASDGVGTLTIRTLSGQPLFETPVVVTLSPPPPDTTTSIDTTEPETNEGETETETTVTEDTTGAATDVDGDEDVDEPTDDSTGGLPDWAGGALTIFGLILLGAILRWLIRRRPKAPPPPPPPPPPRSSPKPPDRTEQPEADTPRPTLGVRGDPGTQSLDAPAHAGPTLVAALNSGTAAVTLTDRNEGADQ